VKHVQNVIIGMAGNEDIGEEEPIELLQFFYIQHAPFKEIDILILK
jgi:hypothetical protein